MPGLQVLSMWTVAASQRYEGRVRVAVPLDWAHPYVLLSKGGAIAGVYESRGKAQHVKRGLDTSPERTLPDHWSVRKMFHSGDYDVFTLREHCQVM